MYAQIRTTQFTPEHCDNAVAITRDFIVPAIEQQPGNRGVYQLIDRAEGKVVLITLWENEAAMATPFDRSFYMREQSVLHVGHAMARTVEVYEVDAIGAEVLASAE